MNNRKKITGVILAGGRGRRLGGRDKGLVELEGKPLVSHVIQRLEPQVDALLINANRNIEKYREFGYPVISDSMADFQGPLAGLLTALDEIDTPWMVTVPCDGPLLPEDLVDRLSQALQGDGKASVAVVSIDGQIQPVYALMRKSVKKSLQKFLAGGERGVGRWLKGEKLAIVDFSSNPEAFRNINTQQDHQMLMDKFAK